jgi:hypothetical protein
MSRDSHPLPATRPRWPWLFLCVILGVVCAAGVYTWPAIATLVPSFGHETSAGRMAANDKDALPDILAAQQKSDEQLASLVQTAADQKEQLKTIVDQLVALAVKVDALQHTVPIPAPLQTPAEPSRAPVAQATPRPRKPPSLPKPSGPISTGGTPLGVVPGDTDR